MLLKQQDKLPEKLSIYTILFKASRVCHSVEGVVLNRVQENQECEIKWFDYFPRKCKPSFCLFLSLGLQYYLYTSKKKIK